MKSKLHLSLLAAVCLAFTACNYDSPLTSKATRPVDERLLGDWTAIDKDNPNPDVMHVRRLDDSTYVVAMDKDIYRAFHSDFAGTAFLSVQNLQAGNDDRKYVYFAWELSADGTSLKLKGVSNKVIPEQATATAGMQKLILANLKNPALFGETLTFVRKK